MILNFQIFAYLSIKQWRIVVDVSDLNSKGANTFKTWFSRVNCLHSDRDGLPIFALPVEHFVGEHLSRLLVHGKLGSLLVWLLNDGVLHLPINALVLVHGVHLNHRTPVRRALLYFRRVGCAVNENRFVVVYVSDEHHHDGGGGVDGIWVGHHAPLHAALAIVHGGHIELVLVPVEIDRAVNKTDHSGVWLNSEQTGGCGSADKPERYSITVLKRVQFR